MQPSAAWEGIENQMILSIVVLLNEELASHGVYIRRYDEQGEPVIGGRGHCGRILPQITIIPQRFV
jgi:hypothetical protein